MNRIAHLAMGTPDLRKSRNFYKEVFGLDELERNYTREGDRFWMPGAGENPPDELVRQVYLSDGQMNLTVGDVPVSFKAVGLAHFGFLVDSVSEILNRCQGTGITQIGQRNTSPHGHYDVAIRDPLGVKVDLAERGSTKVWPLHHSGEARGKIQHIALGTPDVVKTANFYKEVFGLQETERKYEPGAGGNPQDQMLRRIYLWDGQVNLTICKVAVVGMYHFGFAVDYMDETRERLEAAGAPFVGSSPRRRSQHNEFRYNTPEGVRIDLSQRGWGP